MGSAAIGLPVAIELLVGEGHIDDIQYTDQKDTEIHSGGSRVLRVKIEDGGRKTSRMETRRITQSINLELDCHVLVEAPCVSSFRWLQTAIHLP